MPRGIKRIKWNVEIKKALASVIAGYIRSNSIYSRKELIRNKHLVAITAAFYDLAVVCHSNHCDSWKKTAIKQQVSWAVTPQSYSELFSSHPTGALYKKVYETLIELEGIKLTA